MRYAFAFVFLLFGCAMHPTSYIGEQYLGAKYASSPLGEEMKPDIDPLIRDDAFDCTTFVETALSGGDRNTLNQIRYQDGNIGFLSRNHFIESDWLRNNANRVQNISHKFGETAVRNVTIDKSSWLRTVHGIDADFVPQNIELEYVPYANLNLTPPSPPVIVLFITDKSENNVKIGTDIAVVHMGFWLPNGMLRHASSEHGAVVDIDMSQYVQNRAKNKRNLGVMVVEIK